MAAGQSTPPKSDRYLCSLPSKPKRPACAPAVRIRRAGAVFYLPSIQRVDFNTSVFATRDACRSDVGCYRGFAGGIGRVGGGGCGGRGVGWTRRPPTWEGGGGIEGNDHPRRRIALTANGRRRGSELRRKSEQHPGTRDRRDGH